MSNTKHTSTPYAVKKGLHGNPDGVTIWQQKLPGMTGAKGIAKMSGVHEQEEIEATAAFIVRACNAHEQLVAALKMALEIGDGCSRGFLGKFYAVANAALAAAEA
ncbi:hypothetical protein [Massilia phosphatilytica]